MMNMMNMMKIIKIVCVLFTVCMSVMAKGQETDSLKNSSATYTNNSNITQQDSKSQSLVMNYYSDTNPFNRSFENDQLVNVQRRLRATATALTCGGIVLTAGVFVVGSIMAVENEWPLGIYIPVETVIVTGILVGTMVSASAVRRKADAIQVAPVYSYNVGKNVSVSAVGIGISTRRYNNKKMGVGVSLAANF